MMLTTGFQLAAARALIGMEQSVLADLASFSVTTIRNMEKAGAGPIAGRSASVQAVQRALEASGVEFLNHGQPGIRLDPVLFNVMTGLLALLRDGGDFRSDLAGKIISPFLRNGDEVTKRRYLVDAFGILAHGGTKPTTELSRAIQDFIAG